jgi:hypothetical protein
MDGMTTAQTVKIFNMDDCTWVAADSLESAWQGFLQWLGYDVSTPEGMAAARKDYEAYEPEELSDAALDRLKFHTHPLEDPCPSGDLGQEDADCPITFREQLERMKQSGETFPCFFATTEC